MPFDLRPALVGAALLIPLLAAQACGGSGGPSPATGGASAADTGGTNGTGGAPSASGGATTGGSNATGGQSASGGASGGVDSGASGGAESGGASGRASLLVPGGTIQVDGADYALPDFYLDQYEVTVARFRKFQEVADAWQASGHPAVGDGAHPEVPESGWQANWLEDFEVTFAEGLVPKWLGYPDSYSDTVETQFDAGLPSYLIDGTDALAINFVPFHIAFAFCIWDGGRLPAAAEWLYAASGGDTPTTYVWGNSPAPDEMFATIPGPSVPNPHLRPNEPWDLIAIPVGSHPASASRFGQHDLASGLGELLRDGAPAEGDETGGLIELAGDENLSGFSFTNLRAVISTSWANPGPIQTSKVVVSGGAMVTFRCARDL